MASLKPAFMKFAQHYPNQAKKLWRTWQDHKPDVQCQPGQTPGVLLTFDGEVRMVCTPCGEPVKGGA